MGSMSASGGGDGGYPSVQVDFYVDNCLLSTAHATNPSCLPEIAENSLVIGNQLTGAVDNTEFFATGLTEAEVGTVTCFLSASLS